MVKDQVGNMQHLHLFILGIKVVIAKSFARIHKANLINNAIIPLVFENANDYEDISCNG